MSEAPSRTAQSTRREGDGHAYWGSYPSRDPGEDHPGAGWAGHAPPFQALVKGCLGGRRDVHRSNRQ